jgi:hypothetical protein
MLRLFLLSIPIAVWLAQRLDFCAAGNFAAALPFRVD